MFNFAKDNSLDFHNIQLLKDNSNELNNNDNAKDNSLDLYKICQRQLFVLREIGTIDNDMLLSTWRQAESL